MTANPPDRLDRIEALAETVLLAIQQLASQQQVAQASLQANIEDVVGMITTQAEQAADDRAIILEIQTEVREIQSEVRGLQTENRRIWEILQGDREG